jgi:hypothetical protein
MNENMMVGILSFVAGFYIANHYLKTRQVI